MCFDDEVYELTASLSSVLLWQALRSGCPRHVPRFPILQQISAAPTMQKAESLARSFGIGAIQAAASDRHDNHHHRT